MATESLSKEMLNYCMQLNEAEKRSVLEMIKTFLTSRESKVYPQSLEEYSEELDRADSEIESGDFILNEDMKKRYLKK